MKRSALALMAVATLTAGVAQPALAAKPKPAPAPKPITKTFYFHSVDNSGTGNGNVNAVVGESATGILPMDAKKPTGATTQSYGTFGAAEEPNHQCFGNGLTNHPTWIGNASGTLTDKVVVSFYTRSTPGNMVVQLFADAADALSCNEEFPAVIAEATVPVKAGQDFSLVTATLKLSKPVKVKSSFSIMLTTEQVVTPQATDVGFDSAAAPSGVAWTCIPSAGKKTC